MILSIKQMKDGSNTKQENIKMAVGLIFGLCADMAVSAALGSLIPGGKGLKRLMRLGGVFILGMVAGEKVEEHVGKMYDDLLEDIREGKAELEEVKAATNQEGSVK